MNPADFIFQILADNYHSFLIYNINTNDLFIYKLNQKTNPRPDDPVDGREFLKEYLKRDIILEEDLWQFESLYHPSDLISEILSEKKKKVFNYRSYFEGELRWMRMELALPQDYSDQNPHILLYNYQMNRQESDFYEACHIYSNYIYKAMRINLQTHEFQIIKELASEKASGNYALSGSFTELTQLWQGACIHPQDIPFVCAQITEEALRKNFEAGDNSFLFYYRRKVGSVYRWVKLIILPSARYTDENPDLLLFVEDVQKEMLRVMDITAGINFTRLYNSDTDFISKEYYQNILSILSEFTQKYEDYTLIDLRKDLAIRYKQAVSGLNPNAPIVKHYSQIINKLVQDVVSPEDIEKFHIISTSRKLQNLMRDKITYGIAFTTLSGRSYVMTFRKIEALHGLPTRVLCILEPAVNEHRLRVQAFGNFTVSDADGVPIAFSRKLAKEVFAYLIDKHGYSISSKDIAMDVLEKSATDTNALKYVSTLLRSAINTLTKAGYPDVIIKEPQSYHVDISKVDCDYYHLLDGDLSYWNYYHNEYMKEYSWAEETNGELLSSADL